MDARFLLFLVCVRCVSSANGKSLKSVIEHDEDLVLDSSWTVNSTVAKAVTRFSCIAVIEDAELLVYGTKAWRFPEQDINLTLAYPSNLDYVITGFRVLIYADTLDTRGFLNSGGLFMKYVSLSFVSSKVSKLWYQFWLYGVPEADDMHKSTIIDYDLC